MLIQTKIGSIQAQLRVIGLLVRVISPQSQDTDLILDLVRFYNEAKRLRRVDL